MKKLLLVRHGKAVDSDNDGDFYRKLSSEGKEDVLNLAKELEKEAMIPGVAFTSPAKRAKKTAKIITKYLNLPKAGKIDTIYDASEGTLLTIINGLDTDADFVMLTGHNPGFSTIAGYLSGEHCDLPTSGAALIEFETENWAEITSESGKIKWKYSR